MRPTDSASSLRDQPLVDHVHGEAHGGEAGALAVARLQHPELALLDGELDVLHVAVVLLQLAADLFELLVDRRHVLLEFGDLLGRADAGDHVLALGVDEVFAVEDLLAGGRVAREGDAGAAVVAHVAEDHRADVGGRAPLVRVAVLPAIDDGPVVHPRAEHGADRPATSARWASSGKSLPVLLLDRLLEALDQFLEVVDVSARCRA